MLKHKDFIITISYGDYTKGSGGTDKVLLSHQRMMNDNNISVFHLSQVVATSRYLKYVPSNYWSVLQDGTFYKVMETSEIKEYLLNLQNKGYRLANFFIHHLMNSNLDEVKKVLSISNAKIVFYLHDYYTVCPNHGLINENGMFCEVKEVSLSNCQYCKYNNIDNIKKINKYKELFKSNKDRLVFICPSDNLRLLWSTYYPEYQNNTKTVYHQILDGKYTKNLEKIPNDKALNIAYIGYGAIHKGWKQWVEATSIARKNRVNADFYIFGSGLEKLSFMKEIKVDFKKDLNAMINALREHKVHVAILWSLWPETYSYTYYEALAANCFVLTNNRSGNIAEQVYKRKNGIVSPLINGLTDLLLNIDELRYAVNWYRMQKSYGPFSLIENREVLKFVEYNNKIVNNTTYKFNLLDKVKSLIYEIVYRVFWKLKWLKDYNRKD